MNEFEKVIKLYLDEYASKDAEFNKKYAEKTVRLSGENALIKQCCNYICQEVKKSGRHGFADAEIYGMAVHFIDESELTAEKGIKGQVVVNHSVDLTEADKARLRKEAEEEYKKEVKKAVEKKTLEKQKAEKEKAKAQKEEAARKQKEYDEADLLFKFD